MLALLRILEESVCIKNIAQNKEFAYVNTSLKIPTLNEVLELCGDKHLVVEIKGKCLEKQLYGHFSYFPNGEYQSDENVVVFGFDRDSIEAFELFARDLRITNWRQQRYHGNE